MRSSRTAGGSRSSTRTTATPQDERIVYDDGYDASNATLFEGIQFPGVTDPDLIWKHGRFHIAQARLRPEKITLSVGWENLSAPAAIASPSPMTCC
jgi:hypothetical protein